MRKFSASLSLLLATVPIAMAQSAVCASSTSAGYTALCTLAQWAQPTIDALAILLLVMGILAAGFELFKRSIGWAIGLFVGASVIFAVLWSMAGPISSTLMAIAQAVNVANL